MSQSPDMPSFILTIDDEPAIDYNGKAEDHRATCMQPESTAPRVLKPNALQSADIMMPQDNRNTFLPSCFLFISLPWLW